MDTIANYAWNLLNTALYFEKTGDAEKTEKYLQQAADWEAECSQEALERRLLAERAAQRMARESDACMEHRTAREDCPNCITSSRLVGAWA